MSTIAPKLLPPSMPAGRVPYRLSVEKYEEMIRLGLFSKRDRLELVEGQLVTKMTKGTKHSAGLTMCWRAIDRAVPPGWHVRVETPVRIPSRDSDLEPDVSVARGTVGDYLELDPGPGDVALVVEVSDSSIEADRALSPTYHGGGIPVYWIVNVRDRPLE